MFRSSNYTHTSLPLPTTVDPSGLRLASDRSFKTSYSFPLTHTHSSSHSHSHTSSQGEGQSQSQGYATEWVGQTDEVPNDWLDLVASSSPGTAHEPISNQIQILPRPAGHFPPSSSSSIHIPPHHQDGHLYSVDDTFQSLELGSMSPDSRRRIRAQTDLMMGLEVQVDGQDENEENEEDWTNEKIFQLANEAWKSNDGARDYSHGAVPSLDLHVQVETHAIERESEDDGGVKTPTPMPKPLPINHHPVRPAGPHVPTPIPLTALPTGATTSSTPGSVDTPVDIQNRRKRILERERLAKLNANTPTRPHVQVSDARMLFNTGSSKRSFAELESSDSGDTDDDDDDDQEGPDPRRKLFTPRLGSEFETRNAELVGRGDIRKESVATQGRKEEWEDEREVLDTPSKSSEYKQTIDSEQEFSDNDEDDRYTPTKSVTRPIPKQPTKRRSTRLHPYGTRDKAHVIQSPIISILDTSDSVTLSPGPARGDERRSEKVRDFEAYLSGPKRLREPRFDMKVFHWAMIGCPELVWQGDGVGVVVPDVQKFYKNVLHKEARERKESKGLKCSQKDLPGETSFERQLSGYGFTRQTVGKSMYITRPDLRRDNHALLTKIDIVWDQMISAAQLPKIKSESVMGASFWRKQVKELEYRLAQESQDLEDHRLCLRDLVYRYQIPQDDLTVFLSKTQLSMVGAVEPIKQGFLDAKDKHCTVPYPRAGRYVEPELVVTPLKSILDDDFVADVKPLRRTNRNTRTTLKKEKR